MVTTLLALALVAAQPAAAKDIQALVGATLIDGKGGSIAEGVILVQGDRIRCIGRRSDCPVPRGSTVHDLTGKFVTPGLVDAHVHFAQTGWLDGRPDGTGDRTVYPYEQTIAALRADPARWHRSYLCSGVTAAFDVGGAPWTVTGPQAVDTERSDRIHVEAAGPLVTFVDLNDVFSYGSLADQPVFLPLESPAQIRADVARLKGWGASAVKVWFLPPPDGEAERLNGLLMEAGAAARDADLPLIVHATELAQAKAALRAGAKMLVHSVMDELVDQEFLDLLRANDAIYMPTLTVSRHWTQALFSVASGAKVSIDDPNRCVDSALLQRIENPRALQAGMQKTDDGDLAKTAARFERIGQMDFVSQRNLKTVNDVGGRIVLATDAGNPLTVHGPSVYRELEAMQSAGMTPGEVIEAATIEGARAMGLAGDIGSLERGKIADLIVLSEDPRKDVRAFRSLTHVMRAGAIRTQKQLRLR